MTTFQAVIYAISHAIGEFFPIGTRAHHTLIPYLVGWSPPMNGLLGVLNLGSLLAIATYFRHDWASMVSSFLQILLFRRKPMTLDERMPLFLGITTLPLLLTSTYLHERLQEVQWTPLTVSAIFAFAGIPLWFFDRSGRKNKGMFDWNWMDAALIGMIQAASILPGWDPLSAILIGALFLNYRRETAAKFAFFASAPLLMSQTLSQLKEVNFHGSSPTADLSWLSFGVAGVMSLSVGLLVIGGFMKHIQNKGLGQYIAYRWILAGGIWIFYWTRSFP